MFESGSFNSLFSCPGGGIGIREGLKILCLSKDLWVRVPPWALARNCQIRLARFGEPGNHKK